MQKFITQYLFISVMYLFHSMIGKRMLASPEYFCETMMLIDLLFTGERRSLWKTRAINLMVSYKVHA
jgi:hypothetical protein